MSFCHSSLPSLRPRHNRPRTVPPLLAWVRKILSSQIMGVELPTSESFTFQRTLSLALHFRGRFVSVQCPWPPVPRHAGQLSAQAAEPLRSAKRTSKRHGRKVRVMAGPLGWAGGQGTDRRQVIEYPARFLRPRQSFAEKTV